MKAACDFCGKPRDEFETEQIHTKSDGVPYTSQICIHCILELKRQLSLFGLTFWVKKGQGHFNAHTEAAAFYIRGDKI